MSTAIAVAGVAVLSGGVLAATNGHRGGPADEVADKVAEILGIDSEELSEALAEARTEVAQEQRDERLDQLVAAGVLTLEQADEIKAWQAARPSVLDDLAPPHAGGHRSPGPAGDERLARLVEDGTITQEQADEIKAWHDDRPDALSEIRPNQGHRFSRHNRGGHSFQGQFRGSFEGRFQGEFEGRFRGQFRGRFPGGSGGFGERFNLEVPGVEGGIELIIPPANGTSA